MLAVQKRQILGAAVFRVFRVFRGSCICRTRTIDEVMVVQRPARICWALLMAALCLSVPASAGLLGLDEERKIGQQVADELEKQYGVHRGQAMNQRVADIGARIGVPAQEERPQIEFSFKVLADKQVNAVACPGGHIYAFRGLCRQMEDDQHLAAVLAHEAAHVTERHGMEALERALGFQLLLGVATGGDSSGLGAIALDLIMKGYSRSQEAEADRVGQAFLFRAGYDVGAMAEMLRALQEATGGGGDTLAFLRTHPSDKSRIRNAVEREAEILLDLGSERPAADPTTVAIIFDAGQEDDADVREVGEALAQQVVSLLNGSAQVRAEFAGVRSVDGDNRMAELGQLAADRGTDSAVGLAFAEPPLAYEGEERKGKVTIKLSVEMQAVSGGAREAEFTHTVDTRGEKRDADEGKKIEETLGRLTEEAAREIAKVILRPPLAEAEGDGGEG
jgi:Zn-dependent protease with chaperone function